MVNLRYLIPQFTTVYEVPDSRNVFLSPVFIATVLICAAVNWVFCFACILIIAVVAFDQVYDVTGQTLSE